MSSIKRLSAAALLPLLVLFAGPALPGVAAADGCYNCSRRSGNCHQCRYTGRDTWKQRQKCKKAGCVIVGTASCSTAANVRVCSGVGSLFDLTPKHAERPQSYPASH